MGMGYYGGYGFGGPGGYTPPSFGGMQSSPWQGYSPYMTGGLFGGGAGGGGYGFNPYENFFSTFEQRLNDLMAGYQNQLTPEVNQNASEAQTPTPTTNQTASAAQNPSATTTPSAPTSTSLALPNKFGSAYEQTGVLGQRGINALKSSAGLTNVAVKQLTGDARKAGYTTAQGLKDYTNQNLTKYQDISTQDKKLFGSKKK